jgi:hypothetical protein
MDGIVFFGVVFGVVFGVIGAINYQFCKNIEIFCHYTIK